LADALQRRGGGGGASSLAGRALRVEAQIWGLSSKTVATFVRNLLVVLGAYYLSRWVAVPVQLMFAQVTNHLIFSGDFEGAVVMPLVLGVPLALVAGLTGAVIAWLIPSHRLLWVLLPAALYFTFGLLGHHWLSPPSIADRVSEFIGALVPAVACVVGAMLVDRRTRHDSKQWP
jgi:hypothetical protein